jgi:hypothetical protein
MHVRLAQELASKSAGDPNGNSYSSAGSSSSSSGPDTPPAAQRGTPTAAPPKAPDAHALAAIFSRLGYAPKIKSSTLKIAQRKGLQHNYLTIHLPGGGHCMLFAA